MCQSKDKNVTDMVSKLRKKKEQFIFISFYCLYHNHIKIGRTPMTDRTETCQARKNSEGFIKLERSTRVTQDGCSILGQ